MKKLQTMHNLPETFVPTIAKVAGQPVAGFIGHYLIKVPSNQYAYVTISLPHWNQQFDGKPEHVGVRADLYDLDDPNVL